MGMEVPGFRKEIPGSRMDVSGFRIEVSVPEPLLNVVTARENCRMMGFQTKTLTFGLRWKSSPILPGCP